MGISFALVARIWRDNDLKPLETGDLQVLHRSRLDAKVRDVVGLYLAPSEKAVVVCVDEKTQIQTLDRTVPILPLRPGLPDRATTTSATAPRLFAALEVATGKVTDACYQRLHTHAEFLAFLKLVAKAPRAKLYMVADNYAAHKHPKVKAWLEANPRLATHFIPTSGSWMDIPTPP